MDLWQARPTVIVTRGEISATRRLLAETAGTYAPNRVIVRAEEAANWALTGLPEIVASGLSARRREHRSGAYSTYVSSGAQRQRSDRVAQQISGNPVSTPPEPAPGRATAILCRAETCSAPVEDGAALARLLTMK